MPVNPAVSRESPAFLVPLQVSFEAFAERDAALRHDLLVRCLTTNAEIWGPKRVFAGYEAIALKIAGFHDHWPHGRLVLASGLNTFGNVARFANAIVDADGSIVASGHSMMELAGDGRIARIVPFWDALPSIPSTWPRHLGVPAQRDAP